MKEKIARNKRGTSILSFHHSRRRREFQKSNEHTKHNVNFELVECSASITQQLQKLLLLQNLSSSKFDWLDYLVSRCLAHRHHHHHHHHHLLLLVIVQYNTLSTLWFYLFILPFFLFIGSSSLFDLTFDFSFFLPSVRPSVHPSIHPSIYELTGCSKYNVTAFILISNLIQATSTKYGNDLITVDE